MAYFWYFLGYGFLGYLLEKLFAALTHAEHRVRKGFLLAPVCPVYGKLTGSCAGRWWRWWVLPCATAGSFRRS